MSLPRLISGLSEIASGHDALICDVWGVIHDGVRHHPAAADALFRFKEKHGPVVLLTVGLQLPLAVAGFTHVGISSLFLASVLVLA